MTRINLSASVYICVHALLQTGKGSWSDSRAKRVQAIEDLVVFIVGYVCLSSCIIQCPDPGTVCPDTTTLLNKAHHQLSAQYVINLDLLTGLFNCILMFVNSEIFNNSSLINYKSIIY